MSALPSSVLNRLARTDAGHAPIAATRANMVLCLGLIVIGLKMSSTRSSILSNKRLHQPHISRRVIAHLSGRFLNRLVERNDATVVQRMGKRDRRVDPIHLQTDLFQERRRNSARVDR